VGILRDEAGGGLVVRIEPGQMRSWDFADDF
jgi:hypothetical protein